MCGRYVTPEQDALEREYGIGPRQSVEQVFRQSYNVAPTDEVPVLRVVREIAGSREVTGMRWGLIPFSAHGQPTAYSTINATIESLETAPTWRGPWRRSQRCVMPCVGFYEWHVNLDGSKQPYFIRPTEDGATFPLAGLWDRSITPSGEVIESCAVITMPANDLLARIHNAKRRMPAILAHQDVDTWLRGTPEQAKAILRAYPSDAMVAWPVSTRVNSTKNNGPDLIQPIDVPPRPLDLFGSADA